MNDDVKYRFTAYLAKSIKRAKAKYLKKKQFIETVEISMEHPKYLLEAEDFNFDEIFPLEMNNYKLQQALETLSEAEFDILYKHVVEKFSLKEISELLGMGYSATRQSYRRSLHKLKSFMGADGD